MLQAWEETFGLTHILACMDATECPGNRGERSPQSPCFRLVTEPQALQAALHHGSKFSERSMRYLVLEIKLSLVKINTWTPGHAPACSNSPFQTGMWHKQAQHKLLSLASRESPSHADPGEDLFSSKPSWAVQESNSTSLLSQQPFRNSKHKQRTADRGMGGGGQEAEAEEPLC